MYETLGQIRKFQASIIVAIGVICVIELISYYSVIYAANIYLQFAKVNDLAYKQRIEFQAAGITSRRIMAELEVSPQGSRTIERAQQKLKLQTDALEASHKNFRTVIYGPTVERWISDANRHQLIDSLIDQYIKRLRQLSSVPARELSTDFRHWSEIDIIASVDGRLMRSFDEMAEEMGVAAEQAAVFLRQVQGFTNIASVLVIGLLGFFVIRPAISQLRKSSENDIRLRQKLQDQSLTDGLTGIGNRKALDETEDRLRKSGAPYFYAVVDLDSFKPINDTFGHAAGDCALVEVSSRIKDALNPGETVFRAGGDEFAVIAEPDDADAHDLGARLVAAFSDPVWYNDRDLAISSSIGIASSADIEGDFTAVAAAADIAMYQGKSRTSACYLIYDPSMGGSEINLETKARLSASITQRLIRPYYQPQFSLSDGRLTGFEALARWEDNISGRTSAATFIAQIEAHGLSHEFNMSMARQVLEQMAEWNRAGLLDFTVSVNFGPALISSDTATRELMDLLGEFPEETPFLTAEITEDVFAARHLPAIREAIGALKAAGIRLSMDDFGTGYGSFRHLREFSFDEWKIERQFVSNIGKEHASEVMIGGFLATARGLDAIVVAEGVETEAQAEFLRSLGCDIAQGFYYSPAVPPCAALDFIRRCRFGALSGSAPENELKTRLAK